MMQTLNPYNTGKTAEIMARYRPIAPKPEAPINPNGDNNNNSSLPDSIRRSPYLMNVWNHLQARPTRTRKRGRTALAPPVMKRARTCLQGLSPPPPPPSLPYHLQVTASPAKTLALQGFVHDPTGLPSLSFIPNLVPLKCGMDTPVATPANTVSLPLLPCIPTIAARIEVDNALESVFGADDEGGGIDLNKAVEAPEGAEIGVGIDSIEGSGCPSPISKFAVIKPQAARPVRSRIIVGRITEDPGARNPDKQVVKKADEVEKEVLEYEALPTLVSDSENQVRISNAAYNEMIGQPECRWLDLMSSGAASRRIGGEIVLDFVNSSLPKTTSNGFTCWVRIEWEKDGKKNVVNAFCDGIRLACDSRDYLFEWRFHSREASESGSNV